MGSQARVTQYQVTHFVRQSVAYNSPAISTGVIVGHLPAGARISSADIGIDVAQNAGATNTVNVGTIPEVNGILQAPLTAVNNLVSGASASTVGLTKTTPTGTNYIVATDVAVVVSLAQTGAAATAGVVTIIVTYFPNL